VLLRQKAEGVSRRCVTFRMADKSPPPRPGYIVWSADPAAAPIGKVVSGTQSPSLGVGIGMAYVATAMAQPGTALAIEIRGRRFPAAIEKKPLYRRPAARP